MSTTAARPGPLEHPLLTDRGVVHGFGIRGWLGPAGLVRPEQVHGVAVARVTPAGAAEPRRADAVLAGSGEPPVGVVTADCLPILLASSEGRRVGAIHAGWRGLAAGVVGETLTAWRGRWGDLGGVAAVIGPHARACCYEVDAPVRDAFVEATPGVARAAFSAHGPGHWMADLASLARWALREAGIDADAIGEVEGACTICDAGRFESYRRDGAASGRLVHAIVPRPGPIEPA